MSPFPNPDFSSYGKLGERVKDHTITKLCTDKQLKRAMMSPFFKEENILEQEDGEHDLIEVTSRKRMIKDDRPLTMAVCILQSSKLHFLRFVYNVLWKYLKPGSFKLLYSDTDSICISKLFQNYYLHYI